VTLDLEDVARNNQLSKELLRRNESFIANSNFLQNEPLPTVHALHEDEPRLKAEELQKRCKTLYHQIERAHLRYLQKQYKPQSISQIKDKQKTIQILEFKLAAFKARLARPKENPMDFDVEQVYEPALFLNTLKVDLETSVEQYGQCILNDKKIIQDLKQEEQFNDKILERDLAFSSVLAEVIEKSEQNKSIDQLIQKLNEQITLMRDNNEELKEFLKNFEKDFFPKLNIPIRPKKTKKQKGVRYSSLSEMITQLIERMLQTPDDPYIRMTESFWQPYVELLLRANMIEKSPENGSSIKLVHFHK